jgi:hypothetical protein
VTDLRLLEVTTSTAQRRENDEKLKLRRRVATTTSTTSDKMRPMTPTMTPQPRQFINVQVSQSTLQRCRFQLAPANSLTSPQAVNSMLVCTQNWILFLTHPFPSLPFPTPRTRASRSVSATCRCCSVHQSAQVMRKSCLGRSPLFLMHFHSLLATGEHFAHRRWCFSCSFTHMPHSLSSPQR